MQKISGSVVLVCHDNENRAILRQIFGEHGWQVLERSAVSDFERCLKSNWSGVILTEQRLPDGTWQDILNLAAAICPQAQVVVTSRIADEHLWAEVLNLGGFDLLALPLDQTEVMRVGTSAMEHSRFVRRKAVRV